ncbi:hypothetical protein [Conexibacter woesei]|uniref:hypothetical protein n=1 Tax=Conexibacter woesei TaxID=191495 RepID=UPI000424A235|nr:hypothetical protein [Conexibacter woesei]
MRLNKKHVRYAVALAVCGACTGGAAASIASSIGGDDVNAPVDKPTTKIQALDAPAAKTLPEYKVAAFGSGSLICLAVSGLDGQASVTRMCFNPDQPPYSNGGVGTFKFATASGSLNIGVVPGNATSAVADAGNGAARYPVQAIDSEVAGGKSFGYFETTGDSTDQIESAQAQDADKAVVANYKAVPAR